MRNLIIVLGDQLNFNISSLKDADPRQDRVLLCEVQDEANYVKHHQLKIAFIFSAMRHFADELRAQSFHVIYTSLEDTDNTHSFVGEITRYHQLLKPQQIIITEPSEWRVLDMMKGLQEIIDCPVYVRKDDRFYCDHEEFNHFAQGRKQLRMEHFYQKMRKKHNVLMDGNKPVGGAWNYDSQNRKSLPKNIKLPEPTQFSVNSVTQSVLDLVSKRFNDHPGNTTHFYFAVTRKQAQQVLEEFISQRLPLFGDYQDTMSIKSPWLFHSHISFYLNVGLLLPREVIHAVESAYASATVPLNAAEGFIRQVLGWREFIRGIYWHMMPEYEHSNYFNHQRPLPDCFWTAKTKMNCLAQCFQNTLDNAYAHHIQRLMVIGNFSLLAGLDPKEVQAWYLAIYADAFEWVEMPNVIGMILHADGGYLASKPYIASGNYINKMSDYCQNCEFSVKEKTGPQACPFNYLYWFFLDKHKEKLSHNPRLTFAYKNLNNMSDDKLDAIKQSAEGFLQTL